MRFKQVDTLHCICLQCFQVVREWLTHKGLAGGCLVSVRAVERALIMGARGPGRAPQNGDANKTRPIRVTPRVQQAAGVGSNRRLPANDPAM